VDVVEDEKSADVLDVDRDSSIRGPGNGYACGPIEQDELKVIVESVVRESALRGTFDERDHAWAEQ
jgi:hypothetical protein